MSTRNVCAGGLLIVLGIIVGSGRVQESFFTVHSTAIADDGPNRERADEEIDFQGVYSCGEGEQLTFTKLGDGVYSYIEDNGPDGIWEGIGVYRNGVLAIGWQRASDGGNLGVSYFEVTRDENGRPVLTGYWTNLGSDQYVAYDPQPQYVGLVRNSR